MSLFFRVVSTTYLLVLVVDVHPPVCLFLRDYLPTVLDHDLTGLECPHSPHTKSSSFRLLRLNALTIQIGFRFLAFSKSREVLALAAEGKLSEGPIATIRANSADLLVAFITGGAIDAVVVTDRLTITVVIV